MKIIVNEKHMYLWSYTNETNKDIIFCCFMNPIWKRCPNKGKICWIRRGQFLAGQHLDLESPSSCSAPPCPKNPILEVKLIFLRCILENDLYRSLSVSWVGLSCFVKSDYVNYVNYMSATRNPILLAGRHTREKSLTYIIITGNHCVCVRNSS